MLGGVFMNVVLGMVLFIFLKVYYGDVFIPLKNIPQGIEVQANSSLYQFGFRTGDQIVSYKGNPITYFQEVSDPQTLVDRNKRYGILRDGKEIELTLPNNYMKTFQGEGESALLQVNWPAKVIVMDSIMDSNKVVSATPAHLAGLRHRDQILMIDSVPVKYFSDVRSLISSANGHELRFTIQRGDTVKELMITPDANGKVGIGALPDSTAFLEIKYSFGESLVEGPKAGMLTLVRQVKSLIMLGSGNANVSKSISGPVKIAAMMNEGVNRNGAKAWWYITAILSMVLAVMNLLPIPALDGGHVVFLTIESIIRRDINLTVKRYAISISFILVLALIVFIMFKDTIELFLGI
jgi:regulator of sigma E protease